MSAVLLPPYAQITAEMSPVDTRIAEVHSHIISVTGQVLDSKGNMSPVDRMALDARIINHFDDLEEAARRDLITYDAAEVTARNLIDGIGIAAPEEKKRAVAFATDCVMIARQINHALAGAPNIARMYKELSAPEVDDTRIKLMLLQAKYSSAMGGSVIRHLGVVPNAHAIEEALYRGAVIFPSEALQPAGSFR